MKRLLVLTVLSLFIASAALADHIGIYSDDSGSSCNLTPTIPLTETTAVIHKFAVGTVGSRFKVDTSATTGVNLLGIATTFVPIGSVSSDLSVMYGSCLSGSIVVGHLQIFWLGGTPAGTLSVVKTPLYATVLFRDCANVDYPATGGHATINGTGSDCGEPLAVESSTWGSVKALYR